jgi:signal transduction histidine kinase
LRLSFRAKLLFSHLAVVAAVVGLTVWALNRALGEELVQRLDERLREQARGAEAWISGGDAGREGEGGAGPRQRARLGRIASRLADVVDARVIIRGEDGLVLGDSGPPTPEHEMHFVHEKIADGFTVSLGVPRREVSATLDAMRRRILWAGAIGMVAAVLLALLAARVATRPLRAMTESAARMAKGEYRLSLGAQPGDEFGVLARALESLAQQLEARIGELTSLERSRREFMANASHELRTPITAIRAYADTLATGAVDESTRKEFVEIIQRHAERVAALVDDLLALAAIEARPAGQALRERVALRGVATQVLATLARRAQADGTRVHLDVPDDLDALGDPDGVERVLQNLLENALKYGKPGGEVRVSGRREGARVLIDVRDDGAGIAAEHLPRLFERFYRGLPAGAPAQAGTGLGLAIVKQLCESMGGAVLVTSEPGRGACFTVELAAAPARSA